MPGDVEQVAVQEKPNRGVDPSRFRLAALFRKSVAGPLGWIDGWNRADRDLGVCSHEHCRKCRRFYGQLRSGLQSVLAIVGSVRLSLWQVQLARIQLAPSELGLRRGRR